MDTFTSPYSVGLSPTSYQMRFLSQSNRKTNDEITPLHVSVLHQKTDFIKGLIQSYNIDVNHQDDYGNSSLMIAAMKGYVDCIEELFRFNANTSLINQYGQTAILLALRYNHPEAAKLILNNLSNPFQTLSSTDNAGYTSLHYAAYCNDGELLEMIDQLSFVDDMLLNTINPSCSTPLHIAAANGNVTALQFFLNHGGDITSENCMGQSPLLLAISNGHLETVQLLLDISQVNVPDNYGQLALHYAAAGQNVEIVKIVYAAFPNATEKMDTNGNFPYHHAVKSNCRSVLDFFYLNQKRLLVKKNSNGMTPLMLAVACGALESFNYLRELGGDVYVSSMSGTTPFLLTCAYGKLEMAEILFNEDPSVIEDRDNSLNTAAHFAAQNNRISTLKWLRSIAPEIITRSNKFGESPLHIACLCGFIQMIETLQVFGLSLNDTTKLFRTPLHYAVLGGHSSILSKFSRGAPSSCFSGDKNKLTPLHYATAFGFIHMIDSLIDSHPELLNARDGCGRSPLHIAIVMNDACSISKLLIRGADTTMVDIRKLTPAQSAINRGFIHCYELLTQNTTTTSFTAIKKLKVTTPFPVTDDKFLPLNKGDIVDVYWEHKKGWALGSVDGKYGLFPLTKGTLQTLSTEEQQKVNEILSLKKMVKKNADKKNRSASVAFKSTDEQIKKAQTATTVDPSVLLGLQQQQPPRRVRKNRSTAISKDV
ncbi:Inversin-A [Entamoeba marina]